MSLHQTKPFRPRGEADWEPYRDKFTRLYMHEGRPLREVLKILKDEDNFAPSDKQCKNKIKAWGLSKYFKEGEAQQILAGQINAIGAIHAARDIEETKERAARSLKRKRGREQSRDHDAHQEGSESSGSPPQSPPPVPSLTHQGSMSISDAMTPWSPSSQSYPLSQVDSLQIGGASERFLLFLRQWTHDACMNGHWDELPNSKHHSGREANRSFSSNLTAGISLYNQGKESLAWPYWNRAFEGFNENLLKTWYHETPMRLLFEVARVAHSGHDGLASLLLQSIRNWADKTFTNQSDSRHALFYVFGDLQVSELRELYKRAAHRLIEGLESRLDKHHPLLYEVRLTRALDMLWFEPEADLSDWLPTPQEVDDALGPHNQYSVYYLLMSAYRLVAQDRYEEVDDICSQVTKRLTSPQVQENIDPWRVGLAYRRLGRQLHSKGQVSFGQDSRDRYKEARRAFNNALRYVDNNHKLKSSVLIEVCQCQLSMARATEDQDDIYLWTQMLDQLEKQDEQDLIAWKKKLLELEQRIRDPDQLMYQPAQLLLPDTTVQTNKRLRHLSPSPSRSNTL